jgi:hypothetical protein
LDNFITFTKEDREFLFRTTAEKFGNIHPWIIEKDFWVVWILKQLYSLEVATSLYFRGGTTLSKVYNVIRRFSEDIDLGIDRKFFEFIDEIEIYQSTTSSQRERSLRRLNRVTRKYLQQELLRQLEGNFKEYLTGTDWHLKFVQDERQYWIEFYYPRSLADDYQAFGYIRPAIRLEISSRPDNHPFTQREIRPYVADYFPDQFQEPGCEVRAVSIARTFWEKVTLLHKEFQLEKSFVDRLSRHLYDIYMITRIDDFPMIINDRELLFKVVKHKKLFYRQPTAKYDEILQGKLRLLPEGTYLAELKRDYMKMEEMFYDEYPDFQEIVTEISALAKVINSQEMY